MRSTAALKTSMLLAVVGAVLLSTAAAGEVPKNPPPPTVEWHDVKSSAGSEYRIFVWTPKAPPPPSGYPVVYVLDGNAWAPLVADFIRVNETDNGHLSRVKPAIVVGIGYPIDATFDLSRRVLDLTTPTEKIHSLIPDRNGGYGAFFNFIEGVVKPEIERQYRIDREQQTLLGHSLGGEFVLRTLLTHPASFQNYAALSPSIWWDDAALLKDVKTFAPAPGTAAKTHVYLAAGEFEQHMTPAFHEEMLKEYRDFATTHPEILQGRTVDAVAVALDDHNRSIKMVDNARDMQFELASKGFVTRFDSFPDEDHFSAVPSEIGRALPFVLKP